MSTSRMAEQLREDRYLTVRSHSSRDQTEPEDVLSPRTGMRKETPSRESESVPVV